MMVGMRLESPITKDDAFPLRKIEDYLTRDALNSKLALLEIAPGRYSRYLRYSTSSGPRRFPGGTLGAAARA
jgi:hypothetical protein